MTNLSREFNPNSELNRKLNDAIHAFRTGPVKSTRMSRLTATGEGWSMTEVRNRVDGEHVTVYEDTETGDQTYSISGEELLVSTPFITFHKADDSEALHITDISKAGSENADIITRPASIDETHIFLEVLERVNKVFETSEKTDLTEATNQRLEKLLVHDLASGNHPMVTSFRDTGGDNDYLITRVVDHEFYAQLESEARADAIHVLALNGVNIPERLRRKSVWFNLESGIHLIRPTEVYFASGNPAANLLFYPDELPAHARHIKTYESTLPAPVGVLSEAEAETIINKLDTYTDDKDWQPAPGAESRMPPSWELLESTRHLVKDICSLTAGNEAWMLRQEEGNLLAIQRSSRLSETAIAIVMKPDEEFTVRIDGKAAPSCLVGLNFVYLPSRKEMDVYRTEPATLTNNPLKLAVNAMRRRIKAKRYPPRWTASYEQVQALYELLTGQR